VPRDIAFSAALTLSAGTANGVPYLNGSKVLTTGSALTFDGTNFATTGSATGSQLAVDGPQLTDGQIRIFNTTTRASGNKYGIRFADSTLETNASIYAEQSSAGNNAAALVFGVNAGTGGAVLTSAPETMRLTSTGLKASIAGTNADPVFSYTSDTNTGIFFPAADKLGFVAGGGSDDMVLTTTGLGIGTNNPGYKLEVNGVAGVKANNSNAAEFHVNNTNASARDWILLSTGSAWAGGGQTGYFNIYDNTAGQQRLTIDTSGNLGIGATNPGQKLTVNGDALIGTNLFISNAAGSMVGATSPSLYSPASATLGISAGGTERARISSDGTFRVTGAGTAGTTDAVQFSGSAPASAMTLHASGGLSVGTTSDPGANNIGLAAGGKLYYSTNAWITPEDNVIGARISGTQVVGFWTNGSERARITSGGDFQTSSGNSVMIGGAAARATTAGTNRLDIFDGTAPVGTLANGVSFYSTAGEARVMDAAGNATLLSPHDTETNEWIFHSKHTPTGKVLRIDVERLLKFVNDHFGLDAVQEFIEE
jgi:hypothetical protein